MERLTELTMQVAEDVLTGRKTLSEALTVLSLHLRVVEGNATRQLSLYQTFHRTLSVH